MNEIERAIEWFTGRDKRYALSDKCAEMERIALTALREKAERARGCKDCNDSDGILAYTQRNGNPNVHHYMNVCFCPRCGKQLHKTYRKDWR